MFNDIKATNKRVKKQIGSIKTRNATLRKMIQSTLNEIAAHAYQHGDVTLFDQLLDAVRGQDRTALIEWIEEYGFAQMRTSGPKAGTFGKNKTAVDAADFADGQAVYDAYSADNTKVVPWFDFAKSVKQIAKDMTAPQLLNSLMAKLAEHADPNSELEAKGKVRNNVVWGKAHEWDHALANAAHVAQQIQGRMNANTPLAIAAE